ncbi:MAG: heavy-metal-associated domain-containing protein [Chloroflexota bacterium]
MNTVTFSIPNISCGHCVNTIQTELRDVEGVSDVRASAETKTAVVTFDAPATEAGLKKVLAAINYPAA